MFWMNFIDGVICLSLFNNDIVLNWSMRARQPLM